MVSLSYVMLHLSRVCVMSAVCLWSNRERLYQYRPACLYIQIFYYIFLYVIIYFIFKALAYQNLFQIAISPCCCCCRCCSCCCCCCCRWAALNGGSVSCSGCCCRSDSPLSLALSIWAVALQYSIDCASLDLDNVSISCDPLIPQRHVLGLHKKRKRERDKKLVRELFG